MKNYSEEEVKELLKKQRELCAQQVDKFRFNKLYVQIQQAPSPRLR